MINITRYNLDEIQGNDFGDFDFTRMSSALLNFCGKNRHILTQKNASDGGRLLTGKLSSNFLGGFDGGLEVGWYGVFGPELFDKLLRRLELAKQEADNGDIMRSFIRIGSRVVQVLPQGMRCGGVKYKFVILYHGVRFYIHANPRGSIQPVRCKIGAVPLMKYGLLRVYKVILDILFQMGFQIFSESVSRADLQIMTLDYSVQDFLSAMGGGRTVTLARGKLSCVTSLKSMALQSITVHSNTTELCIYNKRDELFEACDKGYFDAFMRRYFPDGVLPEILTRVEFRFRGEALRSAGIFTICDLLDSSRGLCQWASSEWFRILHRPKVAGMGLRQFVAPIWSSVQRVFHSVFSAFGQRSITRVVTPRRAPDVVRLVKQGLGCLSTAAVYAAENFSSFVSEYYNLLNKFITDYGSEALERGRVRSASLSVGHDFYN